MSKRRVSVIVLAGTAGKKMKGLGAKALLDVNGQTILDTQIAAINTAFNQPEVVIVTGYHHQAFDKYAQVGIIVRNVDYDRYNAGHALNLALKHAGGTHVIVVHGDLLLGKASLEGLPKNVSWLLTDNDGQIQQRKAGVHIYEGYAHQLEYGVIPKWAQIAQFTNDELSLLRTVTQRDSSRHLFTHEVINEVIAEGGKFRATTQPKLEVYEVSTARDYATINRCHVR